MTTPTLDLSNLDYLQADRKRLGEELKAINDRIEGGEDRPSLKERAGNLITGIARLDGEIDLARKAAGKAADDGIKDGTLATEPGDGSAPVTEPYVKDRGSLGAPALAFSEKDVKALQSAASGRKAVTVASAPMANQTQYVQQVWPFLRDMARILEFVPTEQTTQPSVTYYRGTTGATAAAAVAAGANKPESNPVWTSFVANVSKLAHYARVDDEVLADFGNFRQVIGTEMLAGLINEENNQLLNGTGVAPNMTGLLNTTGIITRAKGTDSNLDALFKATTDLRTGASYTEPDIIVLNPTDFSLVRLVKDSQGNYITGDPMGSGPVRLWGTPVLVTNRIAAGTALVGNLKEAARAYVRQGPTLDVAPLGGGTAEFIANQTLIRAEERLALAVVRPTAIVKVTGLA